MFDNFLRAFKDWLLGPLAKAVGPGLAPNAISLFAFAVGIAAAAAILGGRTELALALWIANRVLDGFDGTQARVHGTQTDFGGYLDIVLDFIVYAAVPIAILASDTQAGMAVAGTVLLGAFFVNGASWMYLAAILERRHLGAAARDELTTITMPAGIVAGAETVIFYALFIALPTWRVSLFWTMSALVGVNVLQRLWWAWRRL